MGFAWFDSSLCNYCLKMQSNAKTNKTTNTRTNWILDVCVTVSVSRL